MSEESGAAAGSIGKDGTSFMSSGVETMHGAAFERNNIYSVSNLTKNFLKFIQDTVETVDISQLPEDVTNPLKIREIPNWKLDKVRFLL